LPSEFGWGCTVNQGPETGICVSCLDIDGDGFCDSNKEKYCANGFDEDGDSLVDCLDPDCANDSACVIPCVPACLDNNN
jgi:hypothetical protein